MGRAAVTDPYLLEAMREVDAMLPNSPPIAPRPSPWVETVLSPGEMRDAFLARGMRPNSALAVQAEAAMQYAASLQAYNQWRITCPCDACKTYKGGL